MLKPEHFDVLGVLAFTYISGFALFMITNNFTAPPWSVFLLLLVAVPGLLIDLYVVNVYFINKKKQK